MWFLLLLFAAWLLLENGEVFFAFIAFAVGLLSIIAEAEGGRPIRVGAGGPVQRSEARDRPPFTYQLAKAGEAASAIGGLLFSIVRWVTQRPKK